MKQWHATLNSDSGEDITLFLYDLYYWMMEKALKLKAAEFVEAKLDAWFTCVYTRMPALKPKVVTQSPAEQAAAAKKAEEERTSAVHGQGCCIPASSRGLLQDRDRRGGLARPCPASTVQGARVR